MPSSSSKQSPAVTFLSHAWHFSNYPSHRQKNHTMHQTLVIATESGMQFKEGDIAQIYELFRAEWWIRQNAEGHYSRACAAGNNSACLAWEHHFGRPALLWPEKTSKPERLYIGSLITWEGLSLKITSFNNSEQHLIAVGPSGRDNKDVRKKIVFTELQDARKAADKRVKDWIKRIDATATNKEFSEEREQLSQAHTLKAFRHFDLEKLHAALSSHAKKMELTLSSKDHLDRWLAGESHSLRFEDQGQNYLRIKGSNLEVSNGNTVPVSAAYALLGFIQDHRYTQTWRRPSTALDSECSVAGHPLKEITRSHIIIGCTTILWTEIDRITQDLVKAHLRQK
ncbi:MAG: hypothetical protein WAW39_28895 [Prosthecobacter sp.]|uniref:hypothetical protein n=1 Tax=Prosthecobacter sp. TaxID=1965333 RepID=UPI003BB0D76B